ncbi:hypothetical protein EHF33_11090 [Deinococcus psychrotolerans]|uniref:Phosphodiester glycosidase domain-containing protein n=1 Tax=Deinococcus psychrotolerans TaxID=2489213 RepID=A0A3G8YCU5_9DEIO|nr:phosphodiester glycosidase family protein [Deinococcus psychrotolerans]AZI43219.1 hypothetical protein EHF33_11090 [Deinococcus psychrotolerans]
MRRVFCFLILTLSACAPSHALEVSQTVWGGASYTVTTLDLSRDTLRLYWQNPGTKQPFLRFQTLRTFLAGRGEKVLFATNSGIYTPEYAPLGLHIEGGQTLRRLNNARSSAGGGNFALRPNGVFWIKGQQAGVTETDAYAASTLAPDYATQSGPLLVIGGKLHPEFNARSTSFKLRSGVGVCKGGPNGISTVKFAISAAPVNFYTFATFFRDALGCPDALYLDGSISAVYTPQLGDGQFVNYAGIWAVTEKR